MYSDCAMNEKFLIILNFDTTSLALVYAQDVTRSYTDIQ